VKTILENKAFRFWLLLGLPLAAVVIAQLTLPGYYMRLVKLLGINVILVASLNLTNGFTGIFSLGHAGFMAVGAYVSALLTIPQAAKATMLPKLPAWLAGLSLPLPAVLPAAGLAALIVAFLIGFPVLRFKGHYLSVATLGLLVILRAVLDYTDDLTNGPRGITGLPDESGTLLILIVMVLTVYVLRSVVRSAYGRSLIAIREDSVAACSLGVNLAASRLGAFCLSAFFAGIGGALWGHLMQVIAPQFFYFNQSFLLVETSIIGGMFSLSGAVVGSLVMTFVPEVLSTLESGMTIFGFALPPLYGAAQLLLAALLVVIIIARPQGLTGYREYVTDSWFDPAVYRAAFDRREWKALAAALKEAVLRARERISRRRPGI